MKDSTVLDKAAIKPMTVLRNKEPAARGRFVQKRRSTRQRALYSSSHVQEETLAALESVSDLPRLQPSSYVVKFRSPGAHFSPRVHSYIKLPFTHSCWRLDTNVEGQFFTEIKLKEQIGTDLYRSSLLVLFLLY